MLAQLRVPEQKILESEVNKVTTEVWHRYLVHLLFFGPGSELPLTTVGWQAVWKLNGRVGFQPLIRTVLDWLRSRNGGLRRSAVFALKDLSKNAPCDLQVIPALVDRLTDS